MLNSAVSDFSAKMSKHFHSNSVVPLSEANLSRHTLQSPASREAKLRHILVYVDLQRELIALAEEEEHNSARLHPHHQQHRTVREKKSATLSVKTNDLAHPNGEEEGVFTTVVESRNSRGLWHNNNNTQPKRSDLAILLHNSTRHEQPHASSTPQQTHERQLQEQLQLFQPQQQNKHHQPSVSPSPIPLRHHDSAVESLRQQRQHHQQQQERNTRQTDALDPSLALPRALPRHRMPEYRDSYLSADLDAEWQIIDDVGPDSPTIPNSHYPAFEFAPGHNESRYALPFQTSSKSAERPIQYRRREESAEEVALQRQPLQRQTSFEKEKKAGRFGRFSLPGKSKRASTTHRRKESLPEMSKAAGGGEGAGEEGVQARSFSMLSKDKDKDNKDRVRFQEGTVAAVDGVESTLNQSASMVKRRSKVRQLLSEIFKKTPKQQQQSQVISAPSPVRRAYPGSGHNILVSASITPQDLPPRAGTSLSHYARESMVDPSLQREMYQIQTPPPTQEHLILAENNNDINNNNNNNNNNDNDTINGSNKDNNVNDDDDNGAEAPFLGQTSLTPPPAASVLRYSTCRPINLDQILSFHQGTAATEEVSNEHKTRPSSNLMPIAGAIKDLVTAAAAGSGSATGSGTGSSDPYTSQRRLVALTPEQPADLEGVGCRPNTYGMNRANDLVVPSMATA
ncbi:hypothetical protein BGZ89_008475 [Linnemannia elongata]|nr:hypothetical protein BGZ89_008475 [Linnemannia elongata]